MQEVWRPVVGYEGLYEVSDQGRVRSLTRTIHCADGRARTFQGQLLDPWLSTHGYKMVTLRKDGNSTKRSVHCLVASAFIGPRPAGLDVLHGESGKLDNRLCNLRYGTAAENMADKLRDGTDNRGENHPMAKLTAEQVRLVRTSIEGASELAARLQVSRDAVVSIRLGRTWAWLDA
jgi:hypothetical protein